MSSPAVQVAGEDIHESVRGCGAERGRHPLRVVFGPWFAGCDRGQFYSSKSSMDSFCVSTRAEHFICPVRTGEGGFAIVLVCRLQKLETPAISGRFVART